MTLFMWMKSLPFKITSDKSYNVYTAISLDWDISDNWKLHAYRIWHLTSQSTLLRRLFVIILFCYFSKTATTPLCLSKHGYKDCNDEGCIEVSGKISKVWFVKLKHFITPWKYSGCSTSTVAYKGVCTVIINN